MRTCPITLPRRSPTPRRVPVRPAAAESSRRRRTSSCCSAPPATWPRRKLLPGMAHLAHVVARTGHPHRRHLDRGLRRRAVPRASPRRPLDEFGNHPMTRRGVGDVRRPADLRAAGRRAGGAGGGGDGRARADARRRGARLLHYLSVPPSAALDRHRDAPRRRSRRALAGGDGEAVRHRPRQRDACSTTTCTRRSTSARSSGSTTSSGKEAAQNILAFRFANGLFEPIWNRNFIDHVQIDIPETLGLDQRAAFYEATGAYKDMVVTHLFQVLAFVAMEPPTALEPRAISEEKNKVFRSMLPIDPRNVVRGQYGGYRDEPGVAPRLRHRDLHRAALRHRQLALGGRAVLPAHRQADGRGAAHHLDRVQGGAAHDVPGQLRRRLGRAGPPDVRPRRRVARCRCRSTASDPGRA